MRFTLRAQLPRLVSWLLLALAVSRSIGAVAQDTTPCAPNCQNSRFFQTTLWTYDSQGTNWSHTAGYLDIPSFESDGPGGQPPGRSIMLHERWRDLDLTMLSVDWSRILAVVIDEPYVTGLRTIEGSEPIEYNPCINFSGMAASLNPLQEQRRQNIAATRAALLDTVADAHAIAPRARVWVNFHIYEANWMPGDNCSLNLNDSSIDVVSLDRYEVNFSAIQSNYTFFIATMPNQQLALVPGTHYRVGGDSPQTAAGRLQGFFDYANSMNQQCNMGLGRMGRTGFYDGCRVWMVAGWVANPALPLPPDTPQYYGILHSSSAAISTAWLSELSKVRRLSTRTLKDEELATIQSLLE
jgi:hypothetical protein